ncbi:MAG: ATP-binding protein, partial [Pseudomonadota bacterium]
HGWPGYEARRIKSFLEREGVEHEMLRAPIAEAVAAILSSPEQRPCSLCSRFRRGFLYTEAPRLQCNKIALGHQLDDMVETLLLNLLFSGRLAAMPPLLTSEDGRNVVIRPLVYVTESETIAFAEERSYPIVRPACPAADRLDQRRSHVKQLVTELERINPDCRRQMMAAMKKVVPSHLLDTRFAFGERVIG